MADQNLANYTAANQTEIYNGIIANLSGKIFYMQSLLRQIENMTYALVDLQFTDMLAFSANY